MGVGVESRLEGGREVGEERQVGQEAGGGGVERCEVGGSWDTGS